MQSGAPVDYSGLVKRFRREQQAPGPDYSELNKFQELASLARAFRENGLPAVICSRFLDLGTGVSHYVYGIQAGESLVNLDGFSTWEEIAEQDYRQLPELFRPNPWKLGAIVDTAEDAILVGMTLRELADYEKESAQNTAIISRLLLEVNTPTSMTRPSRRM